MGRFQFLKEKKFYINLLIILLLCGVLLWITFRLLDRYTRHDKVYTMPDFVGQDFKEVKREHSRDFHFKGTDTRIHLSARPAARFKDQERQKCVCHHRGRDARKDRDAQPERHIASRSHRQT